MFKMLYYFFVNSLLFKIVLNEAVITFQTFVNNKYIQKFEMILSLKGRCMYISYM